MARSRIPAPVGPPSRPPTCPQAPPPKTWLQAVGLRAPSLAGQRLEQQATAIKAQRRAAVVVAAADAGAQQLDPLET